MTRMRHTGLFLRIVAAFLALLTVLAVMPALALDIGAEDTTTAFNEYISFDGFDENVLLTADLLSAVTTLTGNVSVTSTNQYAVKDPVNSENTVIYNSKNSQQMMLITDVNNTLKTTDFVFSADVRFSSLPTRAVDIFTWIYTKADGGSLNNKLCAINENGELLCSSAYEPVGYKLEKDVWVNLMCHYDSSAHEYDIYVDGERIYTGMLSTSLDSSTNSKIRLFNSGQSNLTYKAYVDNVMLYESERNVAPTVIWDLDFETANTNVNAAEWNGMSDVASDISYTSGSACLNIKDGHLNVKQTAAGQELRLAIGNEKYNAGMNGKLSIKMDFTLVTAGDENLLELKRYNAAGSGYAVSEIFLTLGADGKLTLCGKTYDNALELNKPYNIEVILDSVLYTVTLLIDGDVVFDSLPLSQKFDQVELACFTDDAGITRVMPYTGYIKSYVHGGTQTIDQFVVNQTSHVKPDIIRLFHCVSPGAEFNIDNFKVERLESDTMFSTDFTGWEGKTIDGAATDYRFRLAGPTVINDGSDSYIKFANSTSEQRFHIADKYSQYFGKSVKLSAELFLEEKAATTTTAGFLGIWNWKTVYSNATQNAGGVNTNTILQADGEGNIYDNMAISKGPIAKLNIGEPTKLEVIFIGDGENWIKWQLYIDGELKYETNRELTGYKTNAFVLYNIMNTDMICDNISISLYDKVKALDMDFEPQYMTETAIDKLDWNFGTFDYATDVLGDSGSKYLHIATSNTPAYADANLSKFAGGKEYLIETSVRYSGSGDLNVVKLLDANKNGSALLTIRGEDNRLVVLVDGKEYDVKVPKDAVNATIASVDTFTDIGVIVNGKTNTYTLYVDGKLAYYIPDGAEEKQPCANISFAANDSDVSYAYVRLFETNTTGVTIDVDDVKLITLDNSLGSTIKGAQTRIVFDTNTYGVRFVSGIDTLYGTAVGFEITANYVKDGESHTKTDVKSSSLVFDRIEANDKYVYASDLDCEYISVISVMGIPMEQTVEFTVKPFIAHDTVKCYGEEYTTTYQAAENLNTVALTEEVTLKPLGRSGFVDGVFTADHAASGVALNLDCEGEVRLVIDTAKAVNFSVNVDGVTTKNLLVKAGSWDVTVATNLEKAVHTIELINETGFVDGSRVDIKSVRLNGKVAEVAPEDKALYIEFIGDSISAGYGLSANTAAYVQKHDATLAHPYLTAELLGTDYCITAKSGMGIAYGGILFGDIYPYANVNRGETAFVPARTPDLVVINLHTNDSLNWVDDDTDNFDTKFDEMIQTIKEQYDKDIPMLFVYGCMTSEADPGAYSVRATERSQYLLENNYTDYNVNTVTLTTNREGLSDHPNAEGAELQANELANFIKENYTAFSDIE